MYSNDYPPDLLDSNQVITPNGSLRRVTKFYVGSDTFFTKELNYLPCSVTVSGQAIRGWKDQGSGRFVPDKLSRSLGFLDGLGAIDPSWAQAAKSVHDLERMCAAKRSLRHGLDDCQPPPCPPETDPLNWLETAKKFYVTRTLGNGAIVHGTLGPTGDFYPDTGCPNAPLWEVTEGTS